MATSSGSITISATIDTSAAERDVLAALRRIERKSTLNLNTKNFSQPLGRITGQADEFQKSLEASNARVVAFGASAGIIYNVEKAFSALISSTIEVEKSLTDINVVLNSSTKTLTQFGDQLFNVAKQTGSSFNQVTEAAIEFSRQGLSLEDTLKRTRDALILTRLAGLDVVSSTEALTSAVNSFTKEALTTTDVVNKLAAVDAKFAVSSRDLSEAVKRVGSSASEAGVSFDELLGIVTSVQQTTARGGAVIGNALKTIFTRIQRPEVINDLRDFGVAVKDIEGNTLPIVQVLENLAKSFEDLNPVIRAQVGELVGGVFQINILKAALSDLSKENSIFQAATSASNKAIDDAIIKNNALNKSITALVNEASVNLVQFGKNIGNVSVGPGIKNLVGILNDSLNQINEKSGESVGAKIGSGLLKGITSFITGPGLILGSVVLGKLFGRFAGFTADATKNLLGLNSVSQQRGKLEESIKGILQSNPAIIGQLITGEKTRLQIEKEIRDVLIQQSSLAESIKNTSESFSKSFIASGMGVNASNLVVSNRLAPTRRTSKGFLPNFSDSMASQMTSEVSEATKLGAKKGVRARLSEGTIGGKKFILNTDEKEFVGVGRNGDSMVIPKYGGGMEKAIGMMKSGKMGSILGGSNSGMSFDGFIPNFAQDDEESGGFGPKQFRDYMRKIGKAYRVDKIINKQGKKVAGPLTWNLSDKNYFTNLKPQELEEFQTDLQGFQKEYNTSYLPTGYANYLRAITTQINREERKGNRSKSSIPVPEKLLDEPTINAAVLVATMETFKNFIQSNYPAESQQKQAISKKLRIINDQLNTATKLQKEGKPVPVQLSQRLERLKKFEKLYQKQEGIVSQVPAKAFGAKYEDFALKYLKNSAYPDIKSAKEIGLFGTGGEETTDVDAVDTVKRAFFEFKAGGIEIDKTNKKFKNVRSRPENWPLLLGVKFSDVFDQIKGPWQDILVSNNLRDPIYKFKGNKLLRLPSEGGTQDKRLYANVPSQRRADQRAAAISPFSGSLTEFIDEEYSRIMMEKPKAYSKGFIPNFAATKFDKFKLNDRLVMAYGKKNDPESIAKYLVNIGRIDPILDKATKNPILDSKGSPVVKFSGFTTKYGADGYQNLIRHFRSDGVLDYRIVPSNDEKSITSYLRQIRLSDFSKGYIPNFADNNLKDLLTEAKLKSFSSPEDLYLWLTRLSQEKGLRIKRGSSRIGIALDDKMFLKIAANKAGIAQNFVENRILNDRSARERYSDILPEIFASDNRKNLWSITERLNDVQELDGFKRPRPSEQLLGKPASHFMLFSPYSDLENQILKFGEEYDIDVSDFFGGRNIGFTRTSSPKLKLMDLGFTERIAKAFYRQGRIPELGRFDKGFIPNFSSSDALQQYLNNFDSQTVSEFSNTNIRGGRGMSVLSARVKFVKDLLNINPDLKAKELVQILNERRTKGVNVNFTEKSIPFGPEEARRLIAKVRNSRTKSIDYLGRPSVSGISPEDFSSGFIPNFAFSDLGTGAVIQNDNNYGGPSGRARYLTFSKLKKEGIFKKYINYFKTYESVDKYINRDAPKYFRNFFMPNGSVPKDKELEVFGRKLTNDESDFFNDFFSNGDFIGTSRYLKAFFPKNDRFYKDPLEKSISDRLPRTQDYFINEDIQDRFKKTLIFPDVRKSYLAFLKERSIRRGIFVDSDPAIFFEFALQNDKLKDVAQKIRSMAPPITSKDLQKQAEFFDSPEKVDKDLLTQLAEFDRDEKFSFSVFGSVKKAPFNKKSTDNILFQSLYENFKDIDAGEVFNIPSYILHSGIRGLDRAIYLESRSPLEAFKEVTNKKVLNSNKEVVDYLKWRISRPSPSEPIDLSPEITKFLFKNDYGLLKKSRFVKYDLENRKIIDFLVKNKNSIQFEKTFAEYGAAGQQRQYTYIDLINNLTEADLPNGDKTSLPKAFESVKTRLSEQARQQIEKKIAVSNRTFPIIPHLSKETDRVKILKNEKSLYEEGNRMDHCVAGYGDACSNIDTKTGLPKSLIVSTGTATAELNPQRKRIIPNSDFNTRQNRAEIRNFIKSLKYHATSLGKSSTTTAMAELMAERSMIAEEVRLNTVKSYLQFRKARKGPPLYSIDAYQIKGIRNKNPSQEDLELFRDFVRKNGLQPNFASGFVPNFAKFKTFLGKGFIPNFNAVREAINREMDAGFSASQVKIGQSNSLKTSFNPQGLGVYNTVQEPGGLNQGMAFAREAGINPKTKGMSSGFVPNFAEGGFDRFDVTLIAATLIGLNTQIRSVIDAFKNIKESVKAVNSALAEDVKGIRKSAAERINELNSQLKAEKTVRNQSIDAAKQNISDLKKQRKTEKAALDASTKLRAGLGLGPDPAENTKYLSSSRAIGKQIRQQEQLIKNENLAIQTSTADFVTKSKEIGAKSKILESEKIAEAASKTTTKAKADTLIKNAGFGVGLIGAGVANIAEQFIPQQNFQARALTSGVGDVFSYAGTGAAFGPAGAAAGALLGIGIAAKKVVDSNLEEYIYKIGKSIDLIRDKTNTFANASQGYSSSLEQLKTALNDPNARPDALIRFQNLIQESLGQIPDEFRQKVLAAGSDLTKIAEAISDVNKELGRSQQNLESVSSVLQLISNNKGFLSYFGSAIQLRSNDQQLLNRSFTRNINQQDLTKRFGNQQDFDKFISRLSGELFTTYQSGRGLQANAPQVLNLRNLNKVESLLGSQGLLTPELASAFKKAAENFDIKVIRGLVSSLRELGITAFATKEEAANLTSIQTDNVKKNKQAAEALRLLNQQYTNLNFQLSQQIQIEQNRSSAIRDINKIFSEGVINVQRSRVKNLLEVFSPFITDQQRNNIQGQLDLNEITTRQNSQIRDALNKTLDSFNESLTSKIKEITDQAIGVTADLNREPNQIVKDTNLFINNLSKLSNLASQGLEAARGGVNVSNVRDKLAQEIRSTATLTGGQQEVLIQQLEKEFASFQNELARIKAQGEVDLLLQKSQVDFQRKTYELNQRLSFAGGGRALASTGRLGVSDLYDSIADLVGELRQNNAIGNRGENISLLGSSVFKLLDTLTNQLQLNRATTSPIPFVSPESFNKAVSDQLRPLTAISIAGRTSQIRESLNLARQTTEAQIGSIGKESPLALAFKTANENAVGTALLQISSELKLQNIGTYLDILQEEAGILNQLTNEQTNYLKEQIPNLNKNFASVIQKNVKDQLITVNKTLESKLTELIIATKEADINKQIRDLIPSNVPFNDREKFLQEIKDLQKGIFNLNTNLPPETAQAFQKVTNNLLQQIPQSTFTPSGGFGGNNNQSKDVQISDIVRRYSGVTSGTVESILELLNKFQKFSTSVTAKPLDKKQNIAYLEGLMADALKNSIYYEKLLNNNSSNQQPDKPTDPNERIQSLRQQLKGLNLQTEFYLQSNTELVKLQEEVNEILAEGVQTKEQQEKQLQIQLKIRKKELDLELATTKDREKLLYETAYGRNFFREEKQAAAEARITAEARQGNVPVGSIVRSVFEYGPADAAKDTGDTLKILLTDFKTGIAGAFSEAIKGTKTLREAFSDFFQSLLNRLTDRATAQLVDTVLGAAQKGFSSFNFGTGNASASSDGAYTAGGVNTVTGAGAKKYGGLIKGYNFGGLVTGGSGFRDDVPAMMSGGEFVIKQSSVKKYGADFLDQLNSGQIQTAADGGSFSVGPMRNEFLYNDPERPTSGEYSVDPRLSAFALTDENNPQNKIREQRFEELDRYLQDRDQYEKDRKKAISDFNKKVQSVFNQALIAAAIQIVASTAAGYASKGGGDTKTEPPAKNAKGGLIPKFAFGGAVRKLKAGGMAGKDNIPALLMGNEYVMSPEATKYYGTQLMSDLNKGTFNRVGARTRFAEGGLVGSGSSVSYRGNAVNNNFDELVVAINTLNESISKSNGITQSETGGVSPNFNAQGQLATSSIVNNISVNVSSGNVSATSETNSDNKNSNQNQNLQNNQKLAELLKGKIVEVIVEQKRPGGLLASVKP